MGEEFPWRRILFFGAHPDDEIISAGGTLAHCVRHGGEVTVVIMTQGDTGYASPEEKERIVQLRADELARSQRILGYQRCIRLGRPTQGLVNDRETYQECVRIVREVRPDVILTHWSVDRHRDHRATSEIVDEARYKAAEHLMPDLGQPWYTPALYYCETFELLHRPSLLVDISDTLEVKVAALQAQTSQQQVLVSPVGYVRALARVRGWAAGVECAEAFLISNFFPTVWTGE